MDILYCLFDTKRKDLKMSQQQTEQQREKERKEREQRELKEKGGNVEQQQGQTWQQGKQQDMGQQQGMGKQPQQTEYNKYSQGENVENRPK
jgi:hypothetical protein